MNKDQVKGAAEKVKGKVNETVGKATGDPAQQAKGNVQQGAGEVRKAYGDAKEDIKKDRPESPLTLTSPTHPATTRCKGRLRPYCIAPRGLAAPHGGAALVPLLLQHESDEIGPAAV